jgi:hypothetical protein
VGLLGDPVGRRAQQAVAHEVPPVPEHDQVVLALARYPGDQLGRVARTYSDVDLNTRLLALSSRGGREVGKSGPSPA